MTTSCRRAGQRARRPYDSSGMAVVGILNAVLPPFQLADDDTLRERIPVALAHPTWWSTTLVIVVLGWRWLHRVR